MGLLVRNPDSPNHPLIYIQMRLSDLSQATSLLLDIIKTQFIEPGCSKLILLIIVSPVLTASDCGQHQPDRMLIISQHTSTHIPSKLGLRMPGFL